MLCSECYPFSSVRMKLWIHTKIKLVRSYYVHISSKGLPIARLKSCWYTILLPDCLHCHCVYLSCVQCIWWLSQIGLCVYGWHPLVKLTFFLSTSHLSLVIMSLLSSCHSCHSITPSRESFCCSLWTRPCSCSWHAVSHILLTVPTRTHSFRIPGSVLPGSVHWAGLR